MADAKKKTTKKKRTTWETLSAVDVSEHTEKKNGFTYLSWAWAWGVLMDHFPGATFENHRNADGFPCFFDPRGNAMVRVSIVIDGVERTEDFPVLDFRNSAVLEPDSFQVNTALKRCLVKCMAYFGLGHYIYAGEDLPQSDESRATFDRDAAIKTVNDFVDGDKTGNTRTKLLEFFSAETIESMTDPMLREAAAHIKKRLAEGRNP